MSWMFMSKTDNPTWMLGYRGHKGEQRTVSTGIPVIPPGLRDATPAEKKEAMCKSEGFAEEAKKLFDQGVAAERAGKELARAFGELQARVVAWAVVTPITLLAAEWLIADAAKERFKAPSFLQRSAVMTAFMATLTEKQLASVGRVGPDAVTAFKRKLGKDYGPGYVNVARDHLSAFFNHALERKLILVNPVLGNWPHGITPRLRLPFTHLEVTSILAEMKLMGELGDEWFGATLVACYTGLRSKEVFGLDWSSIEFDAEEQNRFRLKPTKTNIHGIEVCAKLHHSLEKYLRARWIAEGKPLQGLVFRTLAHRQRSSRATSFAEIMRKAGVKVPQRANKANGRLARKSFYCFRHTVITYLARKNVPKSLRMALAGHTTESTHDRYDHSSADDLDPVIDLLPDYSQPPGQANQPNAK